MKNEILHKQKRNDKKSNDYIRNYLYKQKYVITK